MALTNARLHERARELTIVRERNRLARELHDAVAQEALHNAVRHARATVIAVRLRTSDADVILEVSDDGRGFDVVARGRYDGMGLASMRDRAASVGGRLTIGPKARQGTRVRLEVPR